MTPSKQQSAAQCTQGTSYGFAKDLMWVDKGCRADFQVCYLAGNCWKTNVSSWKYKFFTQVLDGVSCIYSMKVVKQISAADCQLGSTFGFIANNVWVDKGCRADFEICYL
ncbi:lectin ADEL [Aplysia californica]|uniref:Lectin ADEL n=1 Tax=Aplysia californica TaxID=6500 RepID=A0ABM1A1R3_APLCA|nr:lectin ADEL [Aplysia californica]